MYPNVANRRSELIKNIILFSVIHELGHIELDHEIDLFRNKSKLQFQKDTPQELIEANGWAVEVLIRWFQIRKKRTSIPQRKPTKKLFLSIIKYHHDNIDKRNSFPLQDLEKMVAKAFQKKRK